MSAIFYANFDELDLNNLDSVLRDKLLFLHGNNELFYKSVNQEDIEKLKEQLNAGFPISWKEVLKQFSDEDKEVLNNFIAPSIPNDTDLCTDDLGICFDNNFGNFGNVFLKKEKIDFNRKIIELLASFYFQRGILKSDGFDSFKFLYFATAIDKGLAQKYIENVLDKTDFYFNYFNGLLFNKDDYFFDLFIDLKKEKSLKDLSYIFGRPMHRYLPLNEKSYKKALDVYIDEVIDSKMKSWFTKNVPSYTNLHAINELFKDIYVTDGCKDYVYKKYEKFTGINSLFAQVAISYSEIKRLDIFFELEWEKMPEHFKEKYPKKKILSKGNESRKRNFLERCEKDFKKVFDEFCEVNDWQTVAEQCQSVGIPQKYYPEIYYKNKLENVLNDKENSETVRKI